ncbi:MAG: serine/threonine-protein kinase [Planctomycetota bacterium]
MSSPEKNSPSLDPIAQAGILDGLIDLSLAEARVKVASMPISDADRRVLEGMLISVFAAGDESAERDDSGPVTEDLRVGPYRCLSLLGEGGQSRVYLAEHQESGMRVALKVLHLRRILDLARSRLRREADVLAGLDNSSIAKFVEVNLDGEQPWLAIEYIEGVSFESVVAKPPQSEAELRERMAVVASCCEAMVAAHTAGVVHRDLKPANIMLRANGSPVIVDFGIAIILEAQSEKLTQGAYVVGTHPFVSPERLALRHQTSSQDDLWSLGVVLHQAVFGCLPFHGRSENEVIDAVLGDRLFSDEICAMPGRGSERNLIRKALMPDLRDRYRSVRDLADDLERLRRGESILAREFAFSVRLGRWARQHAITLGFVCLISTLATLAVVSISRQANRAERATEQAAGTLSAALQISTTALELYDEVKGSAAPTPKIQRYVEQLDAGIEALEFGDAEGVYSLDLRARVLRERGNIAHRRGLWPDAYGFRVRELALRKEALHGRRDLRTRIDYSIASVLVGDALRRLGDRKAGFERYRLSMEIDRQLAEDFPKDVEALDNLSRSLLRLSDFHWNAGRELEAIELALDHHASARALYRIDPKRSASLDNLVISNLQINKFLHQCESKHELRSRLFEQTAQFLKELRESGASKDRIMRRAWAFELSLAIFEQTQGNFEAARLAISTRLVFFKRRHELDPERKEYRDGILVGLEKLIQLAILQKRGSEAARLNVELTLMLQSIESRAQGLGAARLRFLLDDAVDRGDLEAVQRLSAKRRSMAKKFAEPDLGDPQALVAAARYLWPDPTQRTPVLRFLRRALSSPKPLTMYNDQWAANRLLEIGDPIEARQYLDRAEERRGRAREILEGALEVGDLFLSRP